MERVLVEYIIIFVKYKVGLWPEIGHLQPLDQLEECG